MERNEAIEVIKRNYPHVTESGSQFETALRLLIPELAENEGERKRKEIIAFLTYYHTGQGNSVKYDDDWIAWLEKQGEQSKKHDVCDTCDEKDSCISPCCVKLVEEQGGQKPTDKVEPKFKVGDWLVHKDLVGVTCCITQIHAQHYYLTNNNSFIKFVEEDNYRPWTIQDAKDGDVLAVDNIIFIYERTLASHIISYCKLINDIFEPFNDARTCCEGNPYVLPATQEQRDLLFQKMKEAGYEWDAEKKELKKIEQNPAWSEDDQSNFNELGSFILETYRTEDASRLITWLEYLKDRVQPMQEWSEEDEKHYQGCLNLMKLSLDTKPYPYYNDYLWLKSLEERMKGE